MHPSAASLRKDIGLRSEETTGPAPLTAAQVGLLIESELAGRRAFNILQVIVRFGDEPVDAAHLRAGWQALAARHDALRLRFRLDEANPSQSVIPDFTVDFDTIPLDAPAARQEQALDNWLEADRRRGVDLERTPWRVRLIRLGQDRNVMVWTFHHAQLDGNDIRLLLRELFIIHDELANGREPALPPLSDSFLGHCQTLAGADHGPAREFFREHLAGFDAPNRLAAPFRTDADSDSDIRRTITHRLGREQADALRESAAAFGVTTATMIAAAWGLVIARCSGRDEAVFGMTRSGRRSLSGTGTSAGCRINTLPCRIRLSRRSIGQFLTELRAYFLATRPFEQTPHAEITAVCDIPRPQALYDSILMFDRDSVGAHMHALGPQFAHREVEERSQMATALMLAAYDDPELLLRLEYDPGQYPDASAERLFTYLVNLLQAMADPALDGQAPLAALSMLPPEEQARLIALGTPERPLELAADALSLIDRFEQVAQREQNRIALQQVGEAAALTYGELDARANAIAAHLRARSVRPGDIVGLALPRSVDYIAALLGVMKAEATFMPLDPSYPQSALQDMIDRSGAVHLLTSAAVLETLHPQTIAVTLVESLAGSTQDIAPERGLLAPERPAYVIFTSGSTGQPKGVVIPNRAIAHQVRAISEAYAISPGDRILQFTSLNFDISIEEILPTLVSGATLVLRSLEMAQSAEAFLAGLRDHDISVVNLPTAFWHMLCAHVDELAAPPDLAAHLRLLIVGGERPSPSAVRRWCATYPAIRCLNGYGPTETTITATLHDMRDAPLDGTEIPIGRPIAAARVHVMLPDGSLAPEGVDGELWIGGALVGLGYLDRPDLTAPVFVPDPLDGSALCYRSGDRVTWRGDGFLAYHGRIDRQVKLRGYRIELGAVESALEREAEVRSAVVSVDRPHSADARLLAWITLRDPAADFDAGTLADRLHEALPAQMVPQIVVVGEFPQTPGGKVDIARLPRPEVASRGADLPADADTARIQAILARLLGTDSVGPDQSFFDIGGNSLLSVRLTTLIEREFGRRLSLAALYKNPTARQIAASLQKQASNDPDCVIPIQPQGHMPPIYGVHVLGSNGSFFRPLAARLGPDQPVLGLTVGVVDEHTPVSVPEVAALYRRAIDRHQPEGPLSLVAVSLGSYIAFELARQLQAAGRDVRMVALLDIEGPMGRPRLPLLRRCLAHMLYLHKAGLSHLRAIILAKRDDFHHHLAVERRRINGGAAPREPAQASIGDFVAANELAARSYRPAPYPGRLTIIRATENVSDSPEAIETGLGWSAVAQGGFDLHDVRGGHLTMLEEPFVGELARLLRCTLEARAGADSGADSGAETGAAR